MAFEVEERIRVRAYHLWEANGRPEGRDLEFWEQARQTFSQNGSAAPKQRSGRSSMAEQAGAKSVKRSRRVGKKPAD